MREVIINQGRGCRFFLVAILAEREDVCVSDQGDERVTTSTITRAWPYLIEARSKEEAVRLSMEAAREVDPSLAEWTMKGVAHEMSVEISCTMLDADRGNLDVRIGLAKQEAEAAPA
ncbi:MAG TPA: hypothetical protein VF611_04620 [Pyrinomonadaceae bacterium]|jgi:hypothetical protein